MEFLSASQLQNYDQIIEQIQTENERYEHLKKELEQENDKIVVSRLSDSSLSEKVSHVNVKVFSDYIDLFNLYAGELQSGAIDKLVKCDNCKFYLIEIYISNALTQKLRNQKWLLHINMVSDIVIVSKTLKLSHKIPILDVIALNEDLCNCNIEINLILPCDEWMIIKLANVHVDISYHFQMHQEIRRGGLERKILQVTKSYNHGLDIQELRKPVMLEYKLACDVEKSMFIQTILRHSYHKLDIEIFSQFENDNNFILPFSTDWERHKLIYNKLDKVLTLSSNAKDLCLLKKYLCKQFHNERWSETSSEGAKKLLECVYYYQESCKDALRFYHELRKAWLDLPV